MLSFKTADISIVLQVQNKKGRKKLIKHEKANVLGTENQRAQGHVRGTEMVVRVFEDSFCSTIQPNSLQYMMSL